MKTSPFQFLPAVLSGLICANGYAHESDDPMLFSVAAEQFELRAEEGDDPLVAEGEAWLGTDLHKLWLKLDLEQQRGSPDELEVQALYGRAVAPYWDVLLGVRQDPEPGPSRTWAVLGMQGLAPYFFETDLALFVGEQGAVAARLSVEYELLFTQRLILSSELSTNVFGQNDAETGAGSGLADMSAGLRLRYEIRPEFAPYLGVQWAKKYGNTADFAREHGESAEETAAVAGVRFWF